MEIGIPRGRFQVIRVHPNPEQPDGAFIIRIQDNESGITVVTTLLHDDGIRLAGGFTNANDPATPLSVIHLPDEKEVRVHAGNGSELEEVPAETPAEELPAAPSPPAEPPAS